MPQHSPDWTFFRDALLGWYRPDRRPMPWKGQKDPYLIWLSEIILQQTRVEQGWTYFEKFRDHYPDVHALAGAADEAVMKDWEGLGYYSRARNLLKAARMVSGEMNGVFPQDYQGLLKLPGVGPYTAAAIASFAYNESVAVLDGNVYRILSRYAGIATPIDGTAGKKEFAALAEAALAKKHPAVFNQAIMDFGALVCKPKGALCQQCPLAESCVALAGNLVNELPIKEKKLKKKTRYFHYFWVEDAQGKFLVQQRQEKDIWRDLYQLPLVEVAENALAFAELVQQKLLPAPLQEMHLTYHKTYPPRKQQLTHQTIVGHFHAVRVEAFAGDLSPYQVVSPDEGDRKAFPKLITSFIAEKDVILDLFS